MKGRKGSEESTKVEGNHVRNKHREGVWNRKDDHSQIDKSGY